MLGSLVDARWGVATPSSKTPCLIDWRTAPLIVQVQKQVHEDQNIDDGAVAHMDVLMFDLLAKLCEKRVPATIADINVAMARHVGLSLLACSSKASS